jgi:PP-loop superfamily ATP-utilizing enzyme
VTTGSPPLQGPEAGLLDKASRLHGLLASCESLLVAFSGGADSA